MNNCPITKENAEKYGLTDKQVKSFCNHGCSVDCYKFFIEKFKKKGGIA